jgi:hypothetical protein
VELALSAVVLTPSKLWSLVVVVLQKFANRQDGQNTTEHFG